MRGEPFSVEVEGGRLAGARHGTGAPIVLLHGGPGLSEYLDELDAELDGLGELVSYQQRGLDPSTARGPYTVETHVDDALAVLGAVGPAPALLIGHSWGGHLALHVLARAPERIRAVLLVGTLGAVGDGGDAEFERELLSRLSPEARAEAEELDHRAMSGQGSEDDAVESLRLVWPGNFADPASAPPMPPGTRISVECYAETLQSVRAHLETGELPRALGALRVPVVAVHGTRDPIPMSAVEATVAAIPGATLVRAEDAGHMPWYERPGLVRRKAAALL